MPVTFGDLDYTVLGFFVATVPPLLLSLVWWIGSMALIWGFTVTGRGTKLPRQLIETMFESQYYRFVLLQPIAWAWPWMRLLSLITIPFGLLVDIWFQSASE